MRFSSRFFTTAAIVTCIAILSTFPVTAGSIDLAWDPVADADLSGYRVYYGTTSGTYDQQLDVGNTTSASLTGLDACSRYFVAIKAYDTGGLESDNPSNEIAGLPAPVLAGVAPSSAEQGVSLSLSLTGESFDNGATVEIAGAGVTVDSVSYVSCTELSVSVSVALGAAAGARDVTVVNPDGAFGVLAAAFTVTSNDAPSVGATSPIDGATAIPVDVAPTVTFSEAMDAATITASTVRLLDTGDQPVAQAVGSPQLSADGLVVTIEPASDLLFESVYRIVVSGGDSGVKDQNGKPMAADYQQASGFTTDQAPDTQAPQVSGTSPVDSATGVARTVQPQVTFDEPVDPATVTTSTVQLLDASGQPVAQAVGSPQLSADGLTATIVPASDLDENATYKINVVGGASGVKDTAGNPASSFTQASGFTTENLGPGVVTNLRRTDVR